MRKTVWAFITRKHEEGLQVLVFRQSTCPTSTLDVPGGKVDEGEKEVDALYRIIEDDTGLIHLRFLGKVDTTVDYRGSLKHSEERNTYQVESLELPEDRWTYAIEDEETEGPVQRLYFWLPLQSAYQKLPKHKRKSLRRLCSGEVHLTEDRNRLQEIIYTQFPRQSPL